MRTGTVWIVGFAVLANTPSFAAEQAPSVIAAPPAPQVEPGEQAGQAEYPVPIVQTCINAKAKILSVEIVKSSGYPDLDNAALKVARNTKYSPGTSPSGRKQKKSCVKFKVRFMIKDGEALPEELAPPPVTSRT
jgi:TonB family protein